jgi:hypothetical protein
MTNLSNSIAVDIEPEANGIGIVNQSEKDVHATEYYNISGARIQSPSSGISIRRTIYTDGSAKTEKIYLK